MDAGAALGLAIIPPCVAIFFEMVNPLRHRYVESSVERDLEKFRKVAKVLLVPQILPRLTIPRIANLFKR
jgi:hypothetical protein